MWGKWQKSLLLARDVITSSFALLQHECLFSHHMRKIVLISCLLMLRIHLFAQADNEIQVYASPTIPKRQTIVELHSNYTFMGMKNLPDPKTARWTNETLEITTGIAENIELGFYTFTGFNPSGQYQYLGSQVRPRITVPAKWGWKVGASLSAEFGFFRPDIASPFNWQGEIRPIFDKTINNFYLSFNPNIEFVLTGDDKHWGLTPQLKAVYTIKQKVGVGLEYYAAPGTFSKIEPFNQQEHLLGPMLDLYINPKWEVNTGFLFGLTEGSNQRIFKLLLGRRLGK